MHGHRLGHQHVLYRDPLVATADAQRPSAELAGLDPTWSRLVVAADADGVERTWHLLDTAPPDPVGTLLCVHGNPTWSYLWRDLLARAPAGWRVVAVDQLDMGYSERTGATRRLDRRVADLVALTDAVVPEGRVVTVGHDWGGAISLGWALARQHRLAGVVLTNTAVHQPAGSPAPSLIRLVRSGPLRDVVCVRTTAFVRGALALSRVRGSGGLDGPTRAAYLAPYRTPDRRAAIGAFVADIPLDPDHPSAAALDEIAEGVSRLADVPALLLWGPSDPIFSDLYLDDLAARLPHAAIHRFEGASHLVPEDADVAGAVTEWIGGLDSPAADGVRSPVGARRPLWAGLHEPRADLEAVAEMGSTPRSVTFGELAHDVAAVAAGLRAEGVRPGDRVAVLVPPGIDLVAAVYGCWLAGAAVVVADAGLGVRGISRALRSARPDHLIGVRRARLAARSLRWPGAVIDLADARSAGASADPARIEPAAGDEAAVLFTSGATGPAKGVVYRHHQLEAQRDAIATTYGIDGADRLVAAFAPFALAAPALGITSAVPDMDVTRPGTLDAGALADAVAAIDATLVFASPAALANAIATAGQLDDPGRQAMAGVRILLSAGAPVAPELLRAAQRLMPSAQAHTPYGMTEVLPVADITIDAIEAAGDGEGVCVGEPIPGVQVAVLPLDASGEPGPDLHAEPDVTGEVCVHAAHVKDRYDRLWLTQARTTPAEGWHRTGDVGHLDDAGRLWIEGRLVHVVVTAAGPVTPVGIERRVEQLDGVDLAAAVGVGPVGSQQVVVVVTGPPAARRGALAPLDLADAVREVAGADVAAVLAVPTMPVDIRHNSKIDRSRLARLAEDLLAGP